MGEMTRLIQEYDALCERNPPMEEITAFLRERCLEGPVFRNLMNRPARNYILLTPAFLLALRDDDDELLEVIGSWVRDNRSKDLFLKMDFIGRILGMKESIPDRIRAFLWNAIRERFHCHDVPRIISHPGDYAGNVINYVDIRPAFLPEKLADWRNSTSLTEKMQVALWQDSVPLFEIELTMTGKRVAKTLFSLVLFYEAANLLSHLLKERSKAVAAILSPIDLLFYICARPPKSTGRTFVPVIDTLEELYPGICQKTEDSFGNTPLWYCLYESNWKMAEALIRYGCDPDKRNLLNLSYALCRATMERENRLLDNNSNN